MPDVEVSQVMNAPVQRVWEVLNDVGAYPQLMEHVRSLEVVEHGPTHRLVSWEVDIKGCVMRWLEREEMDAARYRIDYRAIEGDLEEFSGYWQLEALSETTSRATLFVRFDIGIPMLSEMLDPVAVRALKENSEKMLLSLGAQAAHLAAAAQDGAAVTG